MPNKVGGRRKGAGRKRSVGGRRSVPMGIVLGDDLKRDLKLAAEELGITQGDLLRRLASRGLTEKQQLDTIRSEIGRERDGDKK